MEGLEERVALAAVHTSELDAFLREYLPFVKKQAATFDGLDYDDRLSLAMLAFTNAVRQYTPGRGAFLPFAAVCIKNRLTDETRRERRYGENILAFPTDGAEPSVPFAYDRELERQALAEEIDRFNSAMSAYGLDFQELARCCPKQKRARLLCRRLAALVTEDDRLRSDFLRTGRLPQARLAERGDVSVKTVEKHRKYIVALAVLLTGDYPDIRAFLPKEVGK